MRLQAIYIFVNGNRIDRFWMEMNIYLRVFSSFLFFELIKNKIE